MLTRAVDTDFYGGGEPREQEWFDHLVELGYEGFITTSHTFWEGNAQPNLNANTALRRALNAGLWIGCYARPVHLWEQGMLALDPDIREELKFFLLDVEEEETGVFPVTREYVNGVASYGVRPVIYSGSGLWSSVMGNSTEFSDVPLHDFAGDIEGWPQSIDEEPITRYGGWNTPNTMRVGWQVRMANPPQIDGTPVDDNVFTREFIFNETPPEVESGFVGSYGDYVWADSVTVYPPRGTRAGDEVHLYVTSNSSAQITGGLDNNYWYPVTPELLIDGETSLNVYRWTSAVEAPPPEVTLKFEGVHWHSATMVTWRGYHLIDADGHGTSGVSEISTLPVGANPNAECMAVYFGFHWETGMPVSWTGAELEAVPNTSENLAIGYLPLAAMATETPELVLHADEVGRMAAHTLVMERDTTPPNTTPTVTVNLVLGLTVTGDIHYDRSGNVTIKNVRLGLTT